MMTKRKKVNSKAVDSSLPEFLVGRDSEFEINTFGELVNGIEQMKSQLERMILKYGFLDASLRPVLEELSRFYQKTSQMERNIVCLLRMGAAQTDFQNKKLVDKQLLTINAGTKQLLLNLKGVTNTLLVIATADEVQSLGENFRIKWLVIVEKFTHKLEARIKNVSNDLDEFQTLVKILLRSEAI